MELREFAERVLFATTLPEKLLGPETVTDFSPGSALIVPKAPGRSPELRFKPTNAGKTDFPHMPRLENETERGRLLHFFANHELLATELMALALLRFPNAPPAFRRGVLQTLKEEQVHTRLYLERMGQCGVEFGEQPLSGYFWRCVSSMDSPMDYVARLSLTFEQANLDFCRFSLIPSGPPAMRTQRNCWNEFTMTKSVMWPTAFPGSAAGKIRSRATGTLFAAGYSSRFPRSEPRDLS
jgi:hypothetical protein